MDIIVVDKNVQFDSQQNIQIAQTSLIWEILSCTQKTELDTLNCSVKIVKQQREEAYLFLTSQPASPAKQVRAFFHPSNLFGSCSSWSVCTCKAFQYIPLCFRTWDGSTSSKTGKTVWFSSLWQSAIAAISSRHQVDATKLFKKTTMKTRESLIACRSWGEMDFPFWSCLSSLKAKIPFLTRWA